MKSTKLSVLFSLLIAYQVSAAAPLTLQDCFKAALKRSEVLATQQEFVVQAEEHFSQAWGSIMPNVYASYLGFVQDPSQITSVIGASQPAWQNTLKVTADQPLFRGFREYAALDQTGKLITAQKQAYEWAGLQLYSDVAQGFYALLSVQKDLTVVDSELDLYQKRIKDLQDRVEIGRSRLTEVLTIQASQASLLANREQVSNQVEVAKEVLAFLTGLDENIQLNDMDEVPSLTDPLEAYLAKLDNRPDVLTAKKNLEAAKNNITVTNGAHLPSADAIADYYPQRPGLLQNVAWDAEIVVTLPIFTGWVLSANDKIADSQERQSEQALSSVERMAIENIRTDYKNLKSDLSQLTMYQNSVEINEKNYKANLKDYNNGLVTNLDVLVALTSFVDAQRALEKIRYSAKIDYNRLQADTAGRLDWIEENRK